MGHNGKFSCNCGGDTEGILMFENSSLRGSLVGSFRIAPKAVKFAIESDLFLSGHVWQILLHRMNPRIMRHCCLLGDE